MKFPSYGNFKDIGDRISLTATKENGEEQDIVILKNMAASRTPLTPEEYHSVIYRDFALNEPQSLVISMSGGIGDLAIQIETVLRLQFFLKENSPCDFQYFGYVTDERLNSLKRFFEVFPVFEGLKAVNVKSDLKIKYPAKVLRHITDGHTYVDHFSFGHAQEYLWALWGLPGRPPPIEHTKFFLALEKFAQTEIAAMSARNQIQNLGDFVLLCPEANMAGKRKIWPLTYWDQLTEFLVNQCQVNVLFIATDVNIKRHFTGRNQTFIFDPKIGEDQNDFLRLASVIHASKLVISVDTGPAHVAGLIGRNCITLWGPTNPVIFGHSRNINIRVSECTPCGTDDVRSRLCYDNICMKQILPAGIKHLAREALSGRYLPR